MTGQHMRDAKRHFDGARAMIGPLAGKVVAGAMDEKKRGRHPGENRPYPL